MQPTRQHTFPLHTSPAIGPGSCRRHDNVACISVSARDNASHETQPSTVPNGSGPFWREQRHGHVRHPAALLSPLKAVRSRLAANPYEQDTCLYLECPCERLCLSSGGLRLPKKMAARRRLPKMVTCRGMTSSAGRTMSSNQLFA
jgi:hypothetical protein